MSFNNGLQIAKKDASRFLKSNPTYTFTWNVLMTALINDRVWKKLEASFTVISRPSLNEQIDSQRLLLFQNSVT